MHMYDLSKDNFIWFILQPAPDAYVTSISIRGKWGGVVHFVEQWLGFTSFLILSKVPEKLFLGPWAWVKVCATCKVIERVELFCGYQLCSKSLAQSLSRILKVVYSHSPHRSLLSMYSQCIEMYSQCIPQTIPKSIDKSNDIHFHFSISVYQHIKKVSAFFASLLIKTNKSKPQVFFSSCEFTCYRFHNKIHHPSSLQSHKWWGFSHATGSLYHWPMLSWLIWYYFCSST